MNVPISAYVLLPMFAVLAIWFRRDLLALTIASTVFQAASILDINIGGGSFGLPIWVPLFGLSCIVDIFGWARTNGEEADQRAGGVDTLAVVSLTLFFLYSVVSAFLMPFLFEGMSFTAGLSTRHVGGSTLSFSSTNVSQAGYLILSAILFYKSAFRRNAKANAKVLSLYVDACAAAAVVGIYQVASLSYGWYFPNRVIYSNPAYVQLMNDQVAGLHRLNATFTEASIAALFFAGSFGIVLTRCASAHPKVADVLKCLLFALVLILTFSTTAYIVLAAGLAYFAIKTWRATYLGLTADKRSTTTLARAIVMGSFGLILLGAAAIAGSSENPIIESVTSKVLGEKATSGSYLARHNADLAAIDTFENTTLLGAGLGSCRASSALAELLGNVGIIGTGAFLFCVLKVYISRSRGKDLTGLGEGVLVGFALMLLAQAVAVPDLVSPAFWVFLGMLTHCETSRRWMTGIAGKGVPSIDRGQPYEKYPAAIGN